MKLSIVAAVGFNKEIGLAGNLPWSVSSDLKHFQNLTIGHTIIAGRITYESFQRKPLPNRTNIVVTYNHNYLQNGVLVAHSLEEAIKMIPNQETEAFIVGGAGLFAEALSRTGRMYLTEMGYTGPADTYFPDFDIKQWKIVNKTCPHPTKKDSCNFKFVIYDRNDNI